MKKAVTKKGNKNKIIVIFTILLLFTNFAGAQSNNLYVSGKVKWSYKPHKVIEKDGFTDLRIEHKGDIQVSDDDRMVVGISDGGYLKIYKKTFGNKRGIEILSIGGKLKFNYYSGNKKLPFEPEGKEWLAEVLPDVIRKTGIDSERRTLRFYRKGGINAVLSEIKILPFDNVRIKYYNALMNIPELSNNDYSKIIASIGNMLSYDSYKRKLIIQHLNRFLSNNSPALFDAIVSMNYDTEKNKILSEIDISKLPDAQKSGYLKVVKSMSYSTEQYKALVNYNNYFPENEELSAKYFNIIQRMSYDTYRSKILTDLMNKQTLSNTDIVLILANLKSFSYDTEIAKVMMRINSLFPEYDNISSIYFSIFNNMSYDSYKLKILTDYLEKNKIDNEFTVNSLNVLKSFSYDTYKRQYLTKLIPVMNTDSIIIDAFFDVVKLMDYDSEREKVLEKLLQKPDLTDYGLLQIIKAVWWFDYDQYKVEILTTVKKRIQGKPELIGEFKEAVKTIDSDTAYRKLMEDSM